MGKMAMEFIIHSGRSRMCAIVCDMGFVSCEERNSVDIMYAWPGRMV